MTLAHGRCFAEHPTNRLPLLCSCPRFKIHHLIREIDHLLAHTLQQPETEIADDVLAVVVIHKRAVQPHERGRAVVNQPDRQTVVQEGIHVDVRSVGMKAEGVLLNRNPVRTAPAWLTDAGQHTS